MQKLKLKISPCPNDTFAFYHFIHENKYLDVDAEFMDIEELNQSLLKGNADIIKASFPAWFKMGDQYELLSSGSAFGYGCGPLIISQNTHIRTSCTFLSPGRYTTANLLLNSYLGKRYKVIHTLFSEILPALKMDPNTCGVIIHESRFTYPTYGLNMLVDLGDWWENLSSYLPIPLGGIFIKRSLPDTLKSQVIELLKCSILYAFKQQNKVAAYCQKHSQEMDLTVLKKHIHLYVNDYTYELTPKCHAAIQLLQTLC